MAIHVATTNKGRFMYQPNIRAWKGGFYFESNPGLIMWAHRLPELLHYAKKDDINSVKVILSDAFQAEVFKNGWDLYDVIYTARNFFTIKNSKEEDIVPAVVEAIKTHQVTESKKPISIKEKIDIQQPVEDPKILEVSEEHAQEVAEFYKAHPEYDEAINS